MNTLCFECFVYLFLYYDNIQIYLVAVINYIFAYCVLSEGLLQNST